MNMIKIKFGIVGAFFNFTKGLVPEHLGIGQPDFGQYNHLKYSDYAPTCFVLFDSRFSLELGLWMKHILFILTIQTFFTE